MDLSTQREFLIDIEELVEQLFIDTEELRRLGAPGPHKRELLARIFRHLHSIKGVASTAGFATIGQLAHQTETLLDNVRSGRVPLEEKFVETLEQAANAISESLSAAAAGADAKPPVELVQSFHDLDPRDLVEPELPLPELPVDFANGINEQEKQLLREAVRENENLYILTVTFPLAVFDKQFHDLRALITKEGEIISSLPSADSSRPDGVSFRILCASPLEPAALETHLESFPQASLLKLSAGSEVVRVTEDAGREEREETTSTSFVRIQIEELDQLISSAHEVFGQTVAALESVSESLSANARVELKNLDAQIRESLVALEERLIQLRMVPLERVLQRAVRAGRVAANISGKDVKFIVKGGHLKIDKTVWDAVADPLLHLVRNAVDQGIESSADRLKSGKAATGTVRIEATSTAGRVRFLVADDGRGIDPERVSLAAAKLGLVDPGTLLSEQKSMRLIFRPGFSTATEITSVSGRGVGLDIVESAIESVGGAVRVRTEIGRGTEFEIRLPASLGVMRVVLISCGGFCYGIEASSIIDRCKLQNGAKNLISWQDEALPLTPVQDLLSQQVKHIENNDVLICQISADHSAGTNSLPKRHALAVEAIEATQEVLVRSLGRHSALWPGISGAAELWDGTVALVLDLPMLLSTFGNAPIN